MATTAGTVLASILDRIRDPNATMSSIATPPTTADGQSFVFSIISQCQYHVALGERLLTKTATFALANNTALQDLSSVTDLARIDDVRIPGVRDLDGPVEIQAFGRFSRSWLTDTTTTRNYTDPISWGIFGFDKIAVVPSYPSGSHNATLVYRYNPTAVAASGDLMSVPDDTVEHVTRLAELIMRIKTRQFKEFQVKFESLANDMHMSALISTVGGKGD